MAARLFWTGANNVHCCPIQRPLTGKDHKDKHDGQMCRLYLSIVDKMGVRPAKFGDATQPLAEV